MTTETRTLIDLWDILAIEYDCGECGAKFSIRLSSKDIDHPMKCLNCSAEWHKVSNAYNRLRFIELTRAIFQSAQALREMQERPENPIKLNVRLEVAVHEKKVA